jgi:CMP-N,N'-diacetyllegionaminic acid synthase
MNILGVIPARGGSKGIARKNIKMLAGKPLIAWTIETALGSHCFDEVIVSTEDSEIAQVAQLFGAKVPFMRPEQMSRDDTPGVIPVLHAIESLPGFDWVMLLQPTSPLRSVEDIKGMVSLAERGLADSIVSVVEVKKHPNWMFYLGDSAKLVPIMNETGLVSRRQELPTVYVLNGAMYLAKSAWLKKHQQFLAPGTIGFPMPEERSSDIDSQRDWDWVEFSIRKKLS